MDTEVASEIATVSDDEDTTKSPDCADIASCKTHPSRSEYGEQSYWEKRYSNSETSNTYDWYQDYDSCKQLKELLNKWIAKSANVLMIGCGNSKLGEQMYVDGYKHVTSIDFSSNVVELMKRRTAEKGLEDLVYLVMDARNTTFKDAEFDAVIDKGTIDAMMCGKNNITNVALTCQEVSRLLKPGGVFVLITYGKPDTRVEYLDVPEYNWKLSYTTVCRPGEDNIHHVYWMVKN